MEQLICVGLVSSIIGFVIGMVFYNYSIMVGIHKDQEYKDKFKNLGSLISAIDPRFTIDTSYFMDSIKCGVVYYSDNQEVKVFFESFEEGCDWANNYYKMLSVLKSNCCGGCKCEK